MRLALHPRLGAGNFFWHACRVAEDLDVQILFHVGDTSGYARPHSLYELRSQVLRSVRWYRTHGVRAGSQVGVYTADGLLGLVQHIAITSLGGVTVLTNPKMAPDIAADYFRSTDTTLVVGDADLLLACGQEWQSGNDQGDSPLTTEDVRVVTSEEFPPARLDSIRYRHRPDDPVLISHSSGTTGRPKPTSFTHRGFFVGKRERIWNFPSRRTDRMLTALPHSHSSGISYLSLALMLGLPTLMVDEPSGGSVARAMNEFLPTLVLGFPLSLAELPTAELTTDAAGAVHTWMGMGDASHERHIRPLVALGARPVPGGVLPGSTYVDGLGSSEMGMVLFKNVHTADSSSYGRMIGKPVGVVREAVVLDDAGTRLRVGHAGLLGVRTPSVTPGYVNAPTLTEDARRGRYFLTGDVVRQDEQGNWYHLDRTPDVISTTAGPVYSLPLEEVVLMTTQALDAAVVAVDDPAAPGHSLPLGIVLGTDEPPPDAQYSLARCNQALAEHGLAELAALIVATDRTQLPVGVTGKVLKRVLRDRHRDLLSRPATHGVALTADPARDMAGPARGPDGRTSA
jgi:acyl-coenzyme A synthetase/AMP-(fatty) acid ligase